MVFIRAGPVRAFCIWKRIKKESEDKRMDKVKAWFIAAFSAVCAALGLLAIPVFLLVGLNLIDYGTGLAAAFRRGDRISSYRSIWGITKKICMWLLIVIGWTMDTLLKYAVSTVGLTINLPYIVAIVVAVWLICNEVISILENMIDLNMEHYIPPFMMPLAKMIKGQMEDKMRIEEEEEEDENHD